MATATSPTTPGGTTKPRSALYTGGCHCGRIEYTVKLSPPVEDGPVTSCECSICHTNGYLMVYPLESNITWIRGKDEMTSYTFGPARIAHTFCNVCGTSIGGKSNDPNFFQNNRALNVRTLRGVDLEKLKLRNVKNDVSGRSKDFSYDEEKHPSNPYGSRIV